MLFFFSDNFPYACHLHLAILLIQLSRDSISGLSYGLGFFGDMGYSIKKGLGRYHLFSCNNKYHFLIVILFNGLYLHCVSCFKTFFLALLFHGVVVMLPWGQLFSYSS